MTGLQDVLVVVLVVMAAVLTVAAWRGGWLQLTPDGIVDRGPLATLTVPWDALAVDSVAPASPRAMMLRLTYARPDLVRRRGFPLGRRHLRTDAVNALFLGDAILHYVANPDHRQAIGTQAEYDELRDALFHARSK